MNVQNAYSSYGALNAAAVYGAGTRGNSAACDNSAGRVCASSSAVSDVTVRQDCTDASCIVQISAEARLAAAQAAEAPHEPTMEEFKQAFWNKLSKIPCSGLDGTNISINISEAAYTAMKADPEYERKILDLFARDLQNPYASRLPMERIEFTVGATLDDYGASSWLRIDDEESKADGKKEESIWDMIFRKHREFMEQLREQIRKELVNAPAENFVAPAESATSTESSASAAVTAGQPSYLHFTSVSDVFNTASAVVGPAVSAA